MVRRIHSGSTIFKRIVLPLSITLVFLLIPHRSFADIENLYAESYSSSVGTINPSNAYGASDGITAESTDKEKWGVFLQNWTFTMADSGNTTEVSQSAEFYFILIDIYHRYSLALPDLINSKGYLRSITRMGLSPLVGATLIFTRIDLAKRWPLFITIAVILSVLLYMELLIRRYRRPRTKPVHPENASHFSNTLHSRTTKTSSNSLKA